MRRTRHVAVIVAAAMLMGGLLAGAVAQTGQPGAASQAQKPVELDAVMEKLGDAYKELYRGLRRPAPAEQDRYLELIQTMQEQALTAKPLVPTRAEALAEDGGAEMVLGYRQDMIRALQMMLEAEQHILAGEYEQATGLMKKLYAHRSDSHDKYKQDD
ncbi:MAG: hypothetical protein ACLFV3_03615 [Phycisphaeraceae bacterium]